MERGQGALEYLLLIGGALMVSGISLALIVNLTAETEKDTIISGANALCAKFPETDCPLHRVDIKNKTFQCFPIEQNKCRAFDGPLYLSMDEKAGAGGTILDTSGNGYQGTLFGTVTCNVAGKFGSGCSFDGTNNNYILMDGFFPPESGTLSVWVKSNFNEATAGTQHVIFTDGPAGNWDYQLTYQGSAHRYLFYPNNPPTDVLQKHITTDFADWYHIAVTWDATQAQLWIDGSLVDSRLNDFRHFSGGNISSMIGARHGTSPITAVWNGEIDELLIFDRVLPQNQIKFLAQR